MNIIEIIMSAGRSSVDIALYTLIPVMVVMMVIMKYLESVGVLAKIVNVTAPLLKPFRLTGLSLFALIQLNFVSFAAPVAIHSPWCLRWAGQRAVSAGAALADHGPAVHHGWSGPGAVPMLILSLTVVGILKSAGAISLLEQALSPVMHALNIPTVLIMPALVKCLAGGAAYLGVGIMLGACFRVARVARFAILGGLIGIALRGILHAVIY